MKIKFSCLLLVIFSFFALSASAQKKVKVLTIKQADNGKTFTVKKKQSFDVFFKEECPTCGQTWQIIDIDSSIIKFISDSFKSNTCKGCTGGNRDRTMHFKALKAGTSKLTLTYFDQRLNVTIKVK